LFELILKTASGAKTKSEVFGYGEDEFAPGSWERRCNGAVMQSLALVAALAFVAAPALAKV